MIRSVEVLYSFRNPIQNSLLTLFCHFVNFFIDIVFVTQEEGTHKSVVALEGKIGKRVEKEHGDCHPEDHVEEFVEEESEERREYFSEREEDPVIEVTNVVLLVSAFESEEGQVSWHQVAHQASQQRMSAENRAQHKQHGEESDGSQTGLYLIFLLNEAQSGEAIECAQLERFDDSVYK